MKKLLIISSVLLIAAIGAGIWYVRFAGRDDVAGDAQRLQWMRRALAETENVNPEQAIPLWRQVLEAEPQNADLLQNLAVAQVSQLSMLAQRLSDVSSSDAEKRAIRDQLPATVKQARETIARLNELAREADDEDRQNVAVWLHAAADAVEAELLPEVMKPPMFRETVERLAAELRERPDALTLTGAIDQYAERAQDPIEGLSEDLAQLLADVLIPASEAHPRNLFVAVTALKYALAAEDPRAAEIASRTAELAQPIGELLRAETQKLNMTPEGVTDQIAAGVAEENWRSAESMSLLWFNLLNSTEILKIDRRRATPTALDLVATRPINALSIRLASQNPPAQSPGPITFEGTDSLLPPELRAVAVTAVDFDLSGTPEIAVAGAGRLAIVSRDGDSWRTVAETSVAADVRGLTVADLFIVDASNPLRIKKPGPPPSEDSDTASHEMSRHNTFPSVLAWGESGVQIFRIDGREAAAPDARLLPTVEPTGLEEVRRVTATVPVDIDADGDLDLVIATEIDGVGVWINRGNMTFFAVSPHSQLPPPADPVVAMAIGDFDRDLDLDILTMQRDSGTVGWLENLLHLQLRWSPLDGVSPVGQGRGVAIVEWDGNVSWDVAFSGATTVGLAMTETPDAGVVRVTDSETVESGGRLIAADFQNDSWIDLLSYDSTGIRVVSGGPAGFDASEPAPPVAMPVEHAAAADFDGDGRIDLAVLSGGALHVLRNRTDNTGHYIDVRMKGIDDNATGRVNHYAIGSTLELRFGPHYRAQVITDRTTHFGLDGFESADTIRAVLTNGITQNIVDPPIDTVINEIQTLKGSCPYLYAWDGEKFVFVTDCLWAAPLGLQVARGEVVPDRPWEYLKVDGKFLAPRDGYYELRLTEELWELAYFDHVSLIAVDHPSEVEIWTNEKVGPPDVVQPRTFAFSETRPIAAAVGTRGEDVTQLLAESDENYVQGFDRRLRQGLCPPHWIDIDLGPVAEDDEILLVLTGWILPTDTSLNIQIDQNPNLPAVEPPSLWIPGEDGQWEEVIPAMGFPGGKTKTIVVDLTGRFRAADPRVRIRTSAQIYWDAAKLAINPPPVEITETPLQLESATVGYHGFSRQLPRTDTQPHRYHYHDASIEPKWPPLRGTLTQWGDCLPLLQRWDDAMVVLGAGDEIALRFRVPSVPLPEGWTRDFILHSVGWDKDADLNTLAGQSVGPLPFREMQAYPPPLVQTEKSAEVEAKNRWHRNRSQSFREFWTR